MMKREMILIVDDELAVVQALTRLLEIEGYHVVGTTDPKEALEVLRQNTPSIIISDQRMPHMTGVELLLKAHSLSSSTIRFLMSGYTDIDVVISAINDGHVYQYISKPWQETEFLLKIQSAMEYWREQQQNEQMVRQSLSEVKNWEALFQQTSSLMTQTMASSVRTLEKVIRAKDEELLFHSERVSQRALQIAKFIGMQPERMKNLEYAGIFHDIGKIAIRDQILHKAGRLDEDDFTKMKAHPAVGAEILRELPFMNSVADIVFQHHEKFDGSGYPNNRKGEEILLEARILAVADAYDALISKRVYRDGLSEEEVWTILEQSAGSHFDPQVVAAFRRLNETLENQEIY